MLSKYIEKVADALIVQGIREEEDRSIIVYGLTVGIEMLGNIVTTIVIGSLFGLILESLIFLMAFAFVRTYAGGYHCKQAVNCYIVSTTIVIGALSVIILTPETAMMFVSILLAVIAATILYKWAPVETPTKPLDPVEYRFYRQKTIRHVGIESILLILVLLIQMYQVALVIALGLIAAAIMLVLQKILE